MPSQQTNSCIRPMSPADLARHYAGLMVPAVPDQRAAKLIGAHLEFARSWEIGKPIPRVYLASAFHNEASNLQGQRDDVAL